MNTLPLAKSKEIVENYRKVSSLISQYAEKYQRDPKSLTLVAVSKTHSVECIKILHEEFGHKDFGENYAQELIFKAEHAYFLESRNIRWHFIGKIQSNKIKNLVKHVDSFHALDRIEHAQDLDRKLQRIQKTSKVFLSVNLSGEDQKGGITLSQVRDFAFRIENQFKNLELQGLMSIPSPNFNDQNYPFEAPPEYMELALKSKTVGSGKLSLGMTSDLRIAIQAGASILRIGTAIFGERAP